MTGTIKGGDPSVVKKTLPQEDWGGMVILSHQTVIPEIFYRGSILSFVFWIPIFMGMTFTFCHPQLDWGSRLYTVIPEIFNRESIFFFPLDSRFRGNDRLSVILSDSEESPHFSLLFLNFTQLSSSNVFIGNPENILL